MAGETRPDEGAARGAVATVFVSDPTAEAERVARALRGAGYAVVDVPLSMLVARVAVQHPRVVLVDADSDGALDTVARLREVPGADDIHILFLARPGGAVASPEEALAHEGTGLFVRPVEIPALVRKVGVLTGDPSAASRIISALDAVRSTSVPPPSMPAPAVDRRRVSSSPPPSLRAHALLGSSRAPPRGSKIPSEPPTSASGGGRRIVALAPPVSPELQQLLAEAELRAGAGGDIEAARPSPEDEIEAVLPADLLATLDEPLEEEEDDDELAPLPRVSPASLASRERTNDGGASTRTTGEARTGGTPTTGNDRRPPSPRGHTSEPPIHAETHGGTHAGSTGSSVSTTGSEREDPAASAALAEAAARRLESIPPPTAWSGPSSVPPPPPVPALDENDEPLSAMSVQADREAPPAVLLEGDAVRVVARAIAGRVTGTYCFVEAGAERRIVLREGDLVTAASSAEDESLLAFLGVRGDLPKETVRRLGVKFPPFGRHGGAALVARGYLPQDQMWPTLRAHAEWLLVRVLQMRRGTLATEVDPSGRLAGEPGVFGGSTGAAVFVDVVRRILAPADALELIGGPSARVADGPDARLLAECALAPQEVDLLGRAPGRLLRELVNAAPEADLPTVVFALAQLGVLEVLRGVGEDARPEDAVDGRSVAALDAEALRERVRARMHLVDDGDYFAVLGVEHDATGYEIRRAFLELRRTFEPSRLLTPETVDLADDVRKITVVLEEAYDILRDAARRERYRRAIEAVPSG